MIACIRGWEILPNAEKFKYAKLNVDGFCLNCCGTWQH